MKKLFLSAFFIMVITSLSSQNLGVDWGIENQDGDKKSISYPFGWKDGFYYNIRMDWKLMSNSYESHLEKVNQDMEVVQVIDIDYSSDYRIHFDFIHLIDDGFFIFSSKFNKDQSEIEIYSSKFNLRGELLERISLQTIQIEHQKNHGIVKYGVSRNGKNLVALHSYGGKKKEDLICHIIYFPIDDLENSQLVKRSFANTGKFIGIEEVLVNDNNVICIILKRLREKNNEPESQLILINDKITKEIPLEFDNYFLVNFSLTELVGGNFKLSGFYSDKLKANKSFYQGVFIADCNINEGKVDNFSSLEFNKKFLSHYSKSDARNGWLKRAGRYHTNFYPSEEKGGYIIAENQLITESSTQEYKYYVYRDLIVIRYDENNQLKFVRMIPKLQAASYRIPRIGGNPNSKIETGIEIDVPIGMKRLMEMYTSYSAINYDDKLWLMYNDNEKNEEVREINDVSPLRNAYKAVTRLIVINEDALIKKQLLFNNKEIGGYFANSKTNTKKEPFVIGVKKKNSQRFGKLEFTD